MSTLQKVLSGIFLIVGQGAAGMAQGTGKFKGLTPVDVWNSAIDDDLRSQELELNAKEQASKGITNEYQLALEQTKNKEAARSLVAANKWKEISERLGILKDQTANSQLRQDIDINRAVADQKNLELMQKAQNQVSGSVSEYVTSREKAAAAAAAARVARQQKLIDEMRKDFREAQKAGFTGNFDQYAASQAGGPGIDVKAGENAAKRATAANNDIQELAKRASAAGIPETTSALKAITPNDIKAASQGKLLTLWQTAKPDTKVNDLLIGMDPESSAATQKLLAVLNPLLHAESGAAVTAQEMARHLQELRGDGTEKALQHGLQGLRRKVDAKYAGITAGFDREIVNLYKERLESNNPNTPPAGFQPE